MDDAAGYGKNLVSTASPVRTHNLPTQLTSFVGRQRELAEVRRLLHSARLVTLTGVGGVGKSRLALEVAASLLHEYVDGVWVVELASVANSDLMAQAVAAGLSIREQPGRSYRATLCDVLRTKHLLLVLDNCEHLLDVSADLAHDLLQASPHLVLLTTSREPLNVRGEVSWSVPALAVTEIGNGHSAPEAVQLFVERATAVRPEFGLTDTNANAVAEVCARLDGLPLAIELAAARTRAVPVRALLQMLESAAGGLPVLTGGAHGVPERQRTLRAAINWSYELLDADEQALFRRLAVFRGCSLAAIEDVCVAPEHGPGSASIALRGLQTSAVDLATSLVNKSLLRVDEDGEGLAWYSMLETVREFAHERLQASDEGPVVRRRHALFYMRLAEDIEPRLYGPEQVALLNTLEREHANCRSALEWCQEQGYVEPSLRLAIGLCMFWSVHGHVAEGSARLESLLARFPARGAGDKRLLLHARAHDAAGRMAGLERDFARGRSHLQESLALMEVLEDTGGIMNALDGLAFVANQQGDFETQRAYLDRELAVAQAGGGPVRVANARYHLAILAHDQGENTRARALLEECVPVYEQQSEWRALAFTHMSLGWVEQDTGQFELARAHTQRALALMERYGDRRAIALTLADLGTTATSQRDFGQAYEHLLLSLSMQAEIGDLVGIAMVLDRFASLACAQGQSARALRLGGAAAGLREQGGSRLPAHAQRKLDRALESARRELGTMADAAVEAGRALSREAAIDEALATRPTVRSPADAVLSQREAEVARHVARGLTNRQIAAELVIGEATVATHVVHILAKLGLTSRAQIAVWATEHDTSRAE
jgi:predicted ATPase/DNA-binding CsgD family transcriptional regulator